jgi:hypothetical protein
VYALARKMSSYWSKRRRIDCEVKKSLSALDKYGIQEESSVQNNNLDSSNNLSDSNFSTIGNRIDHAQHLDNSNIEEGGEVDSFLSFESYQTNGLSNRLAEWSIKHNITRSALDDVIKIVNPYLTEAFKLPSCAKTVLKTPRNVSTQIIPGGKFVYFGVANQIVKQSELGYLNKISSYPIVARMKQSLGNIIL